MQERPQNQNEQNEGSIQEDNNFSTEGWASDFAKDNLNINSERGQELSDFAKGNQDINAERGQELGGTPAENPIPQKQEYETNINQAIEKIEEEKQEYLQEQDSKSGENDSFGGAVGGTPAENKPEEKEEDDEDQVLDIF